MTLRMGALARRWALYFLAEYASIFVIASVAVKLFWGGWLRPLPNVAWLEYPLDYGVPLGIMGVSGALCFRMARRLKSKVYQLLLMAVGMLKRQRKVTASAGTPANGELESPAWA